MSERDILEVDVLFVGAGPANLSAAIRLAQKTETHNKATGENLEPMIAVIEKASELGNHQLSGAVINPGPLKELFPDFLSDGCPIEAPVGKEALYYLKEKSSIKFPLMPPQLNNHGNYVVSLSKLTAWLGEKAEALGVNIFTGFTGKEIILENNKVCGVITGDQGIDAKGEKKPNFEAGVEIRSKCTVFGEGVRGYLSKQLIPKLNLDAVSVNPRTFETAVKEVWECKEGSFEPGMVVHTMGYPLFNKSTGGAFLYGMKDNLLAIGLVIGLNYEDTFMEPYQELQKLKEHPQIQKWIKGGKSVAYGAKALTSGGYYAMPKLSFEGGMLVGESGGMLDMSRLKGVHIGMRSGILAADRIFENLSQNGAFSAESLDYKNEFFKTQEGKHIYKGRNFHQALCKGLPKAIFHIGLQEITGGRGLIDPMPTKLDRDHYRNIQNSEIKYEIHSGNASSYVDKLSSVYNSGTLHEEDQQAHLKIGDTQVCYDSCEQEYQAPCNRFCPANVYEMEREETKLNLKINFTNCVHCQTCDIKCPMDNITWTPPESGGGPQYKKM